MLRRSVEQYKATLYRALSIECRKTKIKVIIRANQLKLIHVHMVDEKTCANEARLVPVLPLIASKSGASFYQPIAQS